MQTFEKIVDFIKTHFEVEEQIPLHQPVFVGNERKYINECINSTFVSSVGRYVSEFENKFADFVGSRHAIATVNGTAALHIALMLANVNLEDEVITQPLTFIATCNAISYCGAKPVFVDVDKETLGMSPQSLNNFLDRNCKIINNQCVNKLSGKTIKVCLPMHTFGHPCKIEEIKQICDDWNIKLVEDAAESVGSYFKSKHTGTFGLIGTFSFNGNKIITTGGGGMLVTDDDAIAKKAKHITTTAKIPHLYKYIHDMTGYNYRMPNINAALGLAQLENIDLFLKVKRELAELYKNFFREINIPFISEPVDSLSNYWLNAIILKNKDERDEFLKFSISNKVMTRPAWELMNRLEMFSDSNCAELENASWLADRLVNLPSSAILQ